MMQAQSIHYVENYRDILDNKEEILRIREEIKQGAIYIFRKMVDPALVMRMREYLTNVGRNSLPNYHAIKQGAPNFHRLNIWDERAYVKGCFHQFVFFPWNQDVFNFFEVMKDGYYLKNMINGLPKEKFMGPEPEDGCIARLSFQFYPKSLGGLNKHSDPVDHHQLTVPLLIMSKKGEDFKSGGMYVEGQNGEPIFGDDLCEIGDVLFFNAVIPHGVKRIDETEKEDWLSFEGRWMMIFATNKLADNTQISASVDLEQKGG
jgi:hypothetical protein